MVNSVLPPFFKEKNSLVTISYFPHFHLVVLIVLSFVPNLVPIRIYLILSHLDFLQNLLPQTFLYSFQLLLYLTCLLFGTIPQYCHSPPTPKIVYQIVYYLVFRFFFLVHILIFIDESCKIIASINNCIKYTALRLLFNWRT
jgi:hypothetical protein